MMHLFNEQNTGEPLESPDGSLIRSLLGLELEGENVKHSLAHAIIPSGKAVLNHFHPVAEETYYILKGRGNLVIDGAEAVVGPGDTIYIPPKAHHKLSNVGGDNLELLAVCVPAWEPSNTVWVDE